MEEIGIKIPPVQVLDLYTFCKYVLSTLNKAHLFQEVVTHSRPTTSSGAHLTSQDPEGDFYVKYKRLQKQLEFLQVRDHYLSSSCSYVILYKFMVGG